MEVLLLYLGNYSCCQGHLLFLISCLCFLLVISKVVIYIPFHLHLSYAAGALINWLEKSWREEDENSVPKDLCWEFVFTAIFSIKHLIKLIKSLSSISLAVSG